MTREEAHGQITSIREDIRKIVDGVNFQGLVNNAPTAEDLTACDIWMRESLSAYATLMEQEARANALFMRCQYVFTQYDSAGHPMGNKLFTSSTLFTSMVSGMFGAEYKLWCELKNNKDWFHDAFNNYRTLMASFRQEKGLYPNA